MAVREAVPQEEGEGDALADTDKVSDTELQPEAVTESVELPLTEAQLLEETEGLSVPDALCVMEAVGQEDTVWETLPLTLTV